MYIFWNTREMKNLGQHNQLGNNTTTKSDDWINKSTINQQKLRIQFNEQLSPHTTNYDKTAK